MSQSEEKKDNNEQLTINRLASIGEIAAGMAHEVKNPLTAVKGFLDLLKNESPHTYIDIATSELDRAISTLQNLLQVSKPDMDDEAVVAINLCSELESIINLFQDQIYRVDIIKKFRNKNEFIYGKRNLLKKVFFNLVKNAHEAIKDKGTITIEHFKEGNNIIVRITDTGTGIPKEKIKKLGTPFFTTKEEGTGLGLAQVYSTIINHQGKIAVDSEVNVGTTFTIEFPIGKKPKVGGESMDLKYENGQTFEEFYNFNIEIINKVISRKTKSIFQDIDGDQNLTQDNLFASSHKLIELLQDSSEHELIMLAKERGVFWAKMDVPLIYKFEWIQTIYQTFLNILYTYINKSGGNIEEFYQLVTEKRTLIDRFLAHFITSYTNYKDTLIKSQRELVDSLTVPIIPLTDNMAVLPIIGAIDTYRAKRIQERTLQQIPVLNIKRIIIDLSGVAFMDSAVVNHLFKIIDGVNLLGCESVITGIRPEVANTVIEMGIKLTNYVKTKGTLQQALEEYGMK